MQLNDNHSDQILGSVIGAVLATSKNILSNSHLDLSIVVDTMVLAALGAFTGFLVTTLSKFVKRKIFKS